MRPIDADALMETIKAHDYLLVSHINSRDSGMFTLGIQQAVDEQNTLTLDDLRPKGEWIIEIHKESVNYRWNATAHCPFCNNPLGEVYAGMFPSFDDEVAQQIMRDITSQLYLPRYCSSCGAKMGGGE